MTYEEDLAAAAQMLESAGIDPYAAESAGIDPYAGAYTLPLAARALASRQKTFTLPRRPLQLSGPMPDSGVGLSAAVARIRDAKKQEHRASLEDRALVGAQPVTFMGCTQLAVAAGATVNIACQAQNTVRIVKYAVANASANNFAINSITVGRVNQMQNNQAVPADMFRSDSQCNPFESAILDAGTQVVVSVTNTSGAQNDFYSGFQVIDLTQQV